MTERRDAEENVELSVLSAIEHGQSADIALATRIAAAAVLASAGLDAERSRLYLDLILLSLSKNVRHEVLQVMNSLGFEYQGDSAPHYVAKGRAEARVEIVVKLLTLRFGPLAEEVQSFIRSAPDAQLDAVVERVISAQTLEEALAPLS